MYRLLCEETTYLNGGYLKMVLKKSLVNTFSFYIFIVIFLTILILGYFLISNEYNQFEKQCIQNQNEFIKSRKDLIKEEVVLIINNIHFKIEQLNKFDDHKTEVVKNEILEWVNNIRLRQNQYITVNKYDGTILAHYKKKNIGKNMWDFTDQNGVKAVQEAIKVSKNIDGGYVSYIGSIKPSTGKPSKKITYAKSIPDLGWTLSTGVYVDDIDVLISQKRKELKEKIRRNLIKIGSILIFVILILFTGVKFITNSLKSNFIVLSSFLNRAATQPEEIDKNQINFSEFQDLITSVNYINKERSLINEKLARIHEHRICTEEEQMKSIASGLHDGVVQTLTPSISKVKTIRESDVGENTIEKALKETIDTLEKKLKEKTVDLEEMNTALKVLFKKTDEDKKNLEKQTLSDFSNLILPYLGEFSKTNMDSQQQALLSKIEGNVTEVISPIYSKFAFSSFGFSPTEIKVANLIKYGKKSKEIAEILNLSPRTIGKYRERIRSKLSIQNKKVNLQVYLSSLE